MKKQSYFIFLLFSALIIEIRGNPLEKSPKQYSFETGYQYVLSSDFNEKAVSGISVLADYAWQLSGFNQRKKVFLSIPLGYSYLFAQPGNNSRNGKILLYGWTVRHELKKDKKIIPFIGYALMLNQLSFQEIDGSIFGHHTKFETGINIAGNKTRAFFVKVEYSLVRYPSLGNKESRWMHYAGIKTGIRFN
mgnify:CR=1 FL=1